MSLHGTQWKDVMGGLTGRRLALHTAIAEGTATIGIEDTKAQEALGWLVYHRFIWRDGERLVARSTAEAKKLFQEEGGNREAGRQVEQLRQDFYNAQMRQAAEATPPIPPEIRAQMDRDRAEAQARRGPVHAHQPDLF